MTALAAAVQTPCRHASPREMGEWVVCASCGDTRKNPNWHKGIAALVRALVDAAPPLDGEQVDRLRRLIPHAT